MTSEHPRELEPRAEAPPPLGPALGSDRIVSVDVLRGVAVLGILAMNVYAFAMPFAAYQNPLLYGGDRGVDLWAWFFTHLFFDQKFLPVFSMLFGAGLVLMWQRAEERGRKLAKVFYLRNLWLLVLGLLHAYLLWIGDILVSYALLGFLIYFFRRLRPRALLVTATVLLLAGIPVNHLMGRGMAQMDAEATRLWAARESGAELTPKQEARLEEWETGMRPFVRPDAEDVQKDLEIHRGSYLEILEHRAPTVFMMQTLGFLGFALWRVGGLMLLGMGLMKLDVFAARRPTGFYLRVLAAGYGLGLPLAAWSAYLLWSHDFDGIYASKSAVWANWIGGVAVALGHVALVMLAVRRGWLPRLQERLSAAGRMAFTNYVAHSVLLTTLFYGYGFGLYGRIDRAGQLGIVLVVWILQLWWSPLWLRHFRFGPLEWLWRTLTYRRLQPLRRT